MPTSLIVIDLPDIVRFINDMAIEKIMCETLQNAIVLKKKLFFIVISNYYMVLQKGIGRCRM